MGKIDTDRLANQIFISLLTVLFVGLKLTGHIDWSWWWVLSPLWIPFVLGLILVGLALIFGAGKR